MTTTMPTYPSLIYHPSAHPPNRPLHLLVQRDNDYYFIPPNTERSTARYRIDYFDSVKSVLTCVEGEE